MPVQYFALILGLLYIGNGLMGFIPALVEPAQTVPELMATAGVTQGFGYLFGLFPVNIVHNVFHLIVGVIGISAFLLTERFARLYSDTVAVWFGVLGVMGLIPNANTVFGLMPIFGNDVWLHLGTAAVAAYFGFFRDSGYLFHDPRQAERMKESSSE